MKIIWIKKAVKENQNNIDYLIENWEKKVLINYISAVERVIGYLKTNPSLGQYDELINCHKILIVKQIYMFYDIIDGDLYILSFWNNHKKPFWL